jgi:hypothetical protein
MSGDFPTLAEVGEENVRQRMFRLKDQILSGPHTIRTPSAHRRRCTPTTEEIVRHVHENKDARPDSITIGTPSKGGEVKVYFNANASEAEIRALIDKAMAARAYAGGQP